jgi:hypothetical protein
MVTRTVRLDEEAEAALRQKLTELVADTGTIRWRSSPDFAKSWLERDHGSLPPRIADGT